MRRTPCSTDYWHARMFCRSSDERELEEQMLSALKREVPEMCSVTMERACNLQCGHCLYRPEKSSEALSKAARLPKLILRAVDQLPGEAPRLLHEGRIIRPWHVEVLTEARQRRPELRIGLIDNGTYVHVLDEFRRQNFVLDWLDLSLDGPEAIHNAQRGSATAYRDAMIGFRRAREVTKPQSEGGRVTSLFTLTTVNHLGFEAAAEILFPSRSEPLVDQLHLTTMSPTRAELVPLELQDFYEFWAQAKRVFARFGHDANGRQRVFFRFYRHQELQKLARVVGKKGMRHAFTEEILFAPGEVYFTVDGVPCVFAPLSLWPGEEFLIDADSHYGTAYSISHTLASLRRGKSDEGEDLRGFTVEQLMSDFDLKSLYHRCVDQWWRFRGQRYLKEERDILRSF